MNETKAQMDFYIDTIINKLTVKREELERNKLATGSVFSKNLTTIDKKIGYLTSHIRYLVESKLSEKVPEKESIISTLRQIPQDRGRFTERCALKGKNINRSTYMNEIIAPILRAAERDLDRFIEREKKSIVNSTLKRANSDLSDQVLRYKSSLVKWKDTMELITKDGIKEAKELPKHEDTECSPSETDSNTSTGENPEDSSSMERTIPKGRR